MVLLFILKRTHDTNQLKLGIETLDFNAPKDHISRLS